MATVYSETIISTLQTALEAITAGATYTNSLHKVLRYDRPRHLQADFAENFARVQKQGTVFRTAGDGGAVPIEFTVTVLLQFYQDTEDSRSTDDLAADWEYDVVKAIQDAFPLTTAGPNLLQLAVTPYPLVDEQEIDNGMEFVITFGYESPFGAPETLEGAGLPT